MEFLVQIMKNVKAKGYVGMKQEAKMRMQIGELQQNNP
jgi:hypothetical protein